MGNGVRKVGVKWPKTLIPLSAEQRAIREDFMQYWHEVLPKRYSRLERFNHGFPIARRLEWENVRIRTLEIGAGLGEHIAHEDVSFQEYTALELRESMALQIVERFSDVKVLVGDIQERIDVPDGRFDRVVAIHVLEHLPNLPAALTEIRRVLKPNGRFEAVIPCEGGLVYEIGRNMTSRRLFENRYHTSYDWFLRSEHVNNCWEIFDEVRRGFLIQRTQYWPFGVPILHANAVVGLVSTPLNGA